MSNRGGTLREETFGCCRCSFINSSASKTLPWWKSFTLCLRFCALMPSHFTSSLPDLFIFFSFRTFLVAVIQRERNENNQTSVSLPDDFA